MLAVGRSAMNMAEVFNLPVDNHLVERSSDGTSRPLPSEKFYVPGSILRVAVDTTSPIAQGLSNPLDVFYDNSPVFRLEPRSGDPGHQASGVVRQRHSTTERLGVWPGLSAGRRRRGGRIGGEGQAVPLRAGDHLPRAAAWNVQVPVQRHLSGVADRSSAGGNRKPLGEGRIQKGPGCEDIAARPFQRTGVKGSAAFAGLGFSKPLALLALAFWAFLATFLAGFSCCLLCRLLRD